MRIARLFTPHIILTILSLSLGLAPAALAASPAPVSKGQVIYEAGFDGTNDLAGWSGAGELEPGSAGQSLAIRSQTASGSVTLSRRVPVEGLRNCRVRVKSLVRGEGVTAKPNPWNGIKLMLVIQGSNGVQYPQAPIETGSFDWRPCAATARIPADATNLLLVLGLEQVTGKACFDSLSVVVTKTPAPLAVHSPASGPPFTGHPEPRLRGAMISPGIDAEGLRTLGEWKANLIRWQLIRYGPRARYLSAEDYDAWLDAELKKVEAALPLCEKHGIRVVLDLHSPPGGKPTVSGYVGSDDRLFTDKRCQDHFVEVWRRMATRFKQSKVFWGYDLANEPVEDDVAEDCLDWQGLAERTAKAVREIDPDRAIIIECADWGGPAGFRDFEPISVPNVVYSVHMYLPHAFTHQGVHARSPAVRYPGALEGKTWNKAELERALAPVIDFQKRHNIQIYVGEFSAIRWAPDDSAHRYLSDVIDIFEAHGWDWSYHAFREWHGWSVEHGSDPQDTRPAGAPTDRQRLLQSWFAKNFSPH
jgi:hypothetical protein